MKTCFVIQPFDKDKFDKRYNDIFEPAINKAGYQSYRVDKDNSVTIPIEDIEKISGKVTFVLPKYRLIILMYGMN